MRISHRTITYVVYPPYYQCDGSYVRCGTLKQARAQCRKEGFGVGSEVHRNIAKMNNHGYGVVHDITDIFDCTFIK